MMNMKICIDRILIFSCAEEYWRSRLHWPAGLEYTLLGGGSMMNWDTRPALGTQTIRTNFMLYSTTTQYLLCIQAIPLPSLHIYNDLSIFLTSIQWRRGTKPFLVALILIFFLWSYPWVEFNLSFAGKIICLGLLVLFPLRQPISRLWTKLRVFRK